MLSIFAMAYMHDYTNYLWYSQWVLRIVRILSIVFDYVMMVLLDSGKCYTRER